jgi:hypothetical protein
LSGDGSIKHGDLDRSVDTALEDMNDEKEFIENDSIYKVSF